MPPSMSAPPPRKQRKWRTTHVAVVQCIYLLTSLDGGISIKVAGVGVGTLHLTHTERYSVNVSVYVRV